MRWKTELPGRGWSTPVIVQNWIWMTSAAEDGRQLLVLRVHRNTGELMQNKRIFAVAKPEACNKMNSYASPSPVIEGQFIYMNDGKYGVACINATSGKTIRSRGDVNLDPQEGPGASMILLDGRLIFHGGGRDVPCVTAVDCKTGPTVWKAQRSIDMSGVGDYSRKAFSTPLIVKTGNRLRMISPAAQGCYCYDPRDGSDLWRVRYSGFSAVPRPVVYNNTAFVADGFAKPKIHAIHLDGKGDVTDSHIKWVYEQNGPAAASPIVLDDQLLFVSDNGILTSLDARTETLRWRKRIGGNYSVSMIAANGWVYVFDREGKTTVIRPGNKPEAVSENELGEGLMASPSVSGNELTLRTPGHLYCIGG